MAQIPNHYFRDYSASGSSRRGFSFTEILFAVMILGIGFIMVAAIFPVAMQQTAQSGDEVIAANISREATDSITSITNSFVMPPTIPATQSPPPIPVAGEATARPEETRALPSFPQPGQHVIGQVWSFHDDRAHNWTTWPTTIGSAWNDALQINAMWNSVSQNLILPSDRRYAWVAMYRRDGHWAQSAATIITPSNAPNYVLPYNKNIGGTPSATTYAFIEPDPYVQLIVIGVQIRNRGAYDPTVDLQRSQSHPDQPATLEPRLLTATFIVNPANGAPVIQFSKTTNETDCLGPGAFAVISDDGIASSPTESQTLGKFAGQFNGHIYRLGNHRPDLNGPGTDTYELAPGYDVFPDPRFGTNIIGLLNVKVFVVGRGYTNPSDPNNGSSILQFDGGVQDIAAYTTLIYAN